MELYNLVSFAGIFILIGFAWLISNNRTRVNWRVVYWGLGLQFFFAVIVFWIPAGSRFFLMINSLVVRVLDSASAGSRFLFGRLALGPGSVNEAGEASLGFYLAFQGLPTIIFFSALMAILYYYNILPVIIRFFARIFTKLMRISGAESLCAASNIFVGVESALTIKPHLDDMTPSEICTILTAGMATVASNILAVYVFCLNDQFPTIAGHLISASFLSAPAALMMSKLLFPETGRPVTMGTDIHPHYDRDSNIFAAIINGANTGVRLIVGIAALLVAVLGLVALFDLLLGGAGGWINSLTGSEFDWSLKSLMGFLFYLPTLVIGVPIADAGIISRIIGERAIVTELIAYQDLSAVMSKNLLQHSRSAVVTAYALCGFAHVASIAIFTGGISALAPKKIDVMAKTGFRALIAATLACLLTACIAGTFFTESSILFGN